MKEFALKHPILTFLLADSLICGAVNIVKLGIAAFGKRPVVEIKGGMEDESAGDIQ